MSQVIFYRLIYGCTEDHELMSNFELQDHIKDYYTERVSGNSTQADFKLLCTEEIILDCLRYCLRFGNFYIMALEKPKVRGN